jgi:hypothetical protein
MTSNSAYRPSRASRASGLVILLGMLMVGAQTDAGQWFDLNDKALATFDFEGLAVPTSTAELKTQFPDATRDRDRVDEEIGLECYEVRELDNVDLARFFFCDGRLYQLEIVYNLPRVEKLGGMRAIVQKLVDSWGPADHVGESRWTWQRPMYQRRADFYSWPTSAQLTITDMAWMPIVAERSKRADEKRSIPAGL